MSFVLGDFLESIEVVEQPIQEKWCAFEDPVVVGGAEEGRDAGGDEGTSTPMGGGSLSLEAKWKVTRILGTVMYNQLSTLLFHSSPTFPALRVLDQALPSEQREAFASSLIPLLFQERQLLPFFHHLSHHEISQLSEPSVLFRGNTLTTKSMDQLQRFVCRRYLCDALHSWLMDLYEEKYSLEVDPRRLPPSVAQNPTTMAFQRALLLHQVQLLLNCLFASVGRVPPILKAIFAQIRENARDHFFKEGVVGEKREEVEMVQFSSVSSFFFLRLVCPALLSPVQFGLAERYPTEKVGRSLMLIAKILQNLANLAEFGDKEPFMATFNPFLLANFTRMKAFLETICSVGRGVSFGVSLGEEAQSGYDRAIHFSRLHLLAKERLEVLKEMKMEGEEEEKARGDLVYQIGRLNHIHLRSRATPGCFYGT